MPVKASEREGRRVPISIRATDTMRSALEAAASKSGRSMSQEIERRLEQSFDEDRISEALFGEAAHSRVLVQALATAIRRVELITGERWVDDYETLWHARSAVLHILGLMFGDDHSSAPPPKPEGRSDEVQQRISVLGRSAAWSALQDIGLVTIGPNGSARMNGFSMSGPIPGL